jgi:enediyne biosynthesis protein E4
MGAVLRISARRVAIGVVLVATAVVAAQPVAREEPRLRFRNVAEAAGVRFVHQSSPSREKYLVETVPGGVAVFDYNGDGRPDLFFTNGASAPALDKHGPADWNRLYRNDGDLHFTDVTESAGVSGIGDAMGAAAADYDNDGDIDLFVAGVRQHQLLRNRGDGRFDDVTKASGIVSGEWGVAAGWFDADNDGRLDLFVVNYVQWSADRNPFCGDEARGIRIYCHPRLFTGLPNRLYRNRGDGTFEDVSAKAGVLAQIGKGMSVAFADIDRDGRLDAFVTNDTRPNFLFRNTGDGTFAEIALTAGASVPDSGRPISSMGTDVQDIDNDGWDDIFLTALAGETFPVFHNDASMASSKGALAFTDVTQTTGVARATVKASGWCAIAADFDNDGWKDLFTANAHVDNRIGEFEAIAFNQANMFLRNDGRGHFTDVSVAAGFADSAAAHRGCGVADLDGDGRLDLVVSALGTPAEVWKNESAPDQRWLIVRLTGTKSNRDGIGARVTVGTQVRTMTTAIGYASSSHAGLHFGLGRSASPTIDRVEVQWPSGARQVIDGVRTNQVLTITEP